MVQRHATRPTRLSLLRSERGAIFIHTAIVFLGLTAFSTFVADYGMLWTARRQAQNSADAAALAAANSLGYVDINDAAAADAAAIAAASANPVWGQAPSITAADVNIVACPAGSLPNGVCVRADVYRNQERNNPLPVWFGSIVGVSTQGVKATATAEIRFGRAAAECIKPLAIPDKWQEMQTPAWDLTDEFNLDSAPPDLFVAGTGGTGFVTNERRLDGTPGDLGLQVTIKFARGQSDLEPGMYAPVRLGNSDGAADYRNNIEGCWNGTVNPGDQLGVEPGGKVGPTAQAFATIIGRDPQATWQPGPGGVGGQVVGGCTDAGTCGLSPRIIPVIAFNPTIWAQDPNGGPGSGNSGPGGGGTGGGGNGGGGGGNGGGNGGGGGGGGNGGGGGGGGNGGGGGGCEQGTDGCNWNGPGSVTVTQIIGVFVEQVTNNNQVLGRIMRMPTLGLVGTGEDGDANMVNIILVR